MICLDTNYLIRVLVAEANEAAAVKRWLLRGEALCASAVSWHEFLCGPVSDREITVVHGLLHGGILAFEETQAAEAARLFNAVGRPRRLRVDAMIAACAICADCALATANRADFIPFAAEGLKLV